MDWVPPKDYKNIVQKLKVGAEYNQRELMLKFVEMGYRRNDDFFNRGDFRVNGEIIDIFPAYSLEYAIRVEFFGDAIEDIYTFRHFNYE